MSTEQEIWTSRDRYSKASVQLYYGAYTTLTLDEDSL